MPSAAYFRRQADICLRLSAIASDQDLVMRLLAMADEYKAKAGAAEPSDSAAERGGGDAEPDDDDAEPGDRDAELLPAHMTGSPERPDADRDRE